MLAANNKIRTSKLKNLNFAGHPKESDVLTWIQQVCFSYMYLCLFNGICITVLSMLPLKSIVDGVFNPINLHKCVINPCNAIGTYYSALHKDSKLNVKSQRPLGRFCRQQSAMAIMYTNKYIVKYFRYLAGIDERVLAALEKRQFYPSSLNPPGENQSKIVAFLRIALRNYY